MTATITCPSWCTDCVAGVHEFDPPDDELMDHGGANRQVVLTVDGCDPVEARLVRTDHANGQVDGPWVCLENVYLTPVEARSVAAMLLELADAAEGAGTP